MKYKIKNTLDAFLAFMSLIKSPCFVILVSKSRLGDETDADCTGVAPGAQSLPLAALYSALRANKT